MNPSKIFLIVAAGLLTSGLVVFPFRDSGHTLASTTSRQQTEKPVEGGFVYADFETMQNNRPVSSHGGLIQLISYEETTPSKFKGLAGASPAAPELVRIKKDDPNHAMAFDYQLYAPNQYAGVGVEIHGEADKDGKAVPDDLSSYKYLSLQVYATGVTVLRAEIMSRGQGLNITNGFPQLPFKLKPGFNTYRIPLNSMVQPAWQQDRVGAKDVLKKLTAVSITAYCEQCLPISGTIVIDNVIFEK